MNRRTFFASLFGVATTSVTVPAISNATICKSLGDCAALTMDMIHAEHVSFVVGTRFLNEDVYRLAAEEAIDKLVKPALWCRPQPLPKGKSTLELHRFSDEKTQHHAANYGLGFKFKAT